MVRWESAAAPNGHRTILGILYLPYPAGCAMSALHSSGSFCRLVEVLLPNGGGIAAMYEGYFDESGDLEDTDKIFCIAGYYVEADNAKRMDAEWLNVLSEHGLPYFHMVDCAHGNEAFERIARSDRSEIVIRLIKIIKEYTSHGFAVIANGDHFATKEGQPDVYSQCADLCITALHVFC